MKKGVITLFLVFAFAQSGLAQIDFGPRVSILSSNLTLENLPASFGSVDYEVGYQIGAFARVKLPNSQWYIQPEILYTASGGFITDTSGESDYNLERMDMPVLLGRKLGPLRFNAGPVFRYNIQNQVILPTGDDFYNREAFKDRMLGYQAGVGIDVMKFVFDLKFDGSIGDVRNTDPIQFSFPTVTRINQWILSVGFKLL